MVLADSCCCLPLSYRWRTSKPKFSKLNSITAVASCFPRCSYRMEPLSLSQTIRHTARYTLPDCSFLRITVSCHCVFLDYLSVRSLSGSECVSCSDPIRALRFAHAVRCCMDSSTRPHTRSVLTNQDSVRYILVYPTHTTYISDPIIAPLFHLVKSSITILDNYGYLCYNSPYSTS